jgi:hypothetical protein
MNTASQEYSVVNYNPAHYVPLNVVQRQWELDKEQGADRVEDPYGLNPDASTFSAGLNAGAPFILIISMMVITISTMGIRASNASASLGDYLTNFAMIVALVPFIVSLTILFRKIRFAMAQKNAADFALLESARRYLKQRYGFLPKDWENRFISYVVGEEVKENRFSENYQLTVRNYKGYNVIMVANINGEAPVKN